MPKKRKKGQGIDFIIGGYRKIINDKGSTVAQRMKALDRLAVIDGVLEIAFTDPSDQTTQPRPDPELDDQKASRLVKKALSEARKKVGETNELSGSDA